MFMRCCTPEKDAAKFFNRRGQWTHRPHTVDAEQTETHAIQAVEHAQQHGLVDHLSGANGHRIRASARISHDGQPSERSGSTFIRHALDTKMIVSRLIELSL